MSLIFIEGIIDVRVAKAAFFNERGVRHIFFFKFFFNKIVDKFGFRVVNSHTDCLQYLLVYNMYFSIC
jgi:hypothetical protein